MVKTDWSAANQGTLGFRIRTTKQYYSCQKVESGKKKEQAHIIKENNSNENENENENDKSEQE